MADKNPNIKDLPLGIHNVTKIAHIKSGDGNWGQWHMYGGEVQGKKVVIYGKDKDKDVLESGTATIETFMWQGKKAQRVEPGGDIRGLPHNNPDVVTRTAAEEIKEHMPVQNVQKDDVQDRIIRGMCWNAASRTERVNPEEILSVAKKLYRDARGWLAGQEEMKGVSEPTVGEATFEVPLPEHHGQEIDISSLPF